MTAENIAEVYGVKTRITGDAEAVSVIPVSCPGGHHQYLVGSGSHDYKSKTFSNFMALWTEETRFYLDLTNRRFARVTGCI